MWLTNSRSKPSIGLCRYAPSSANITTSTSKRIDAKSSLTTFVETHPMALTRPKVPLSHPLHPLYPVRPPSPDCDPPDYRSNHRSRAYPDLDSNLSMAERQKIWAEKSVEQVRLRPYQRPVSVCWKIREDWPISPDSSISEGPENIILGNYHDGDSWTAKLYQLPFQRAEKDKIVPYCDFDKLSLFNAPHSIAPDPPTVTLVPFSATLPDNLDQIKSESQDPIPNDRKDSGVFVSTPPLMTSSPSCASLATTKCGTKGDGSVQDITDDSSYKDKMISKGKKVTKKVKFIQGDVNLDVNLELDSDKQKKRSKTCVIPKSTAPKIKISRSMPNKVKITKVRKREKRSASTSKL